MTAEVASEEHLDPRRWIILAVLISALTIVGIDATVLNVALPTMLTDFDTSLTTLQWALTGFSLTIASLMVIGGRLGDMFGHRRLFIIGAAVFGVGSLVSALAPNVGVLIFGKAIVEGVGAALMMPTTLALLSVTFRGAERAKAFALWGAAIGASVCFGPPIGGYLTSNHSWRWAFAINVVVAPLAIIAALVFLRPHERARDRKRLDTAGAVLVTLGTFLVIFALSQAPTYGWFEAQESFSVAGVELWSRDLPISIVPVILLVGAGLLVAFTIVERRKERDGSDPLFALSLFRIPTYRFGLIASGLFSLGQFGLSLALALFLQEANDLTAGENGLWFLPMGIALIIGAQLGGRLIRHIGTTNVVRLGFAVQVLGLLVLLPVVTPSATFWAVAVPLACFGIGSGFATSQVASLVLHDVPANDSGVASGASSTIRQIGAALGIALSGTIIFAITASQGTRAVRDAQLSDPVTEEATAGIETSGAAWQAPAEVPPDAADTIGTLLDDAVADGSKAAIGLAAAVMALATILTFLIPHVDGPSRVRARRTATPVSPGDVAATAT